MWETWIWSLDQEDPLEKEMAIHSSILAWRISSIEKSGELHSTGSQWVGHNWASKTTPTYLAVPGLSQETQDLPSLFLACFWPGIKPWLPVLAVRSLSRWTTREVPCLHLWLLWILLFWMWCMDIQSIPCFQFLWVSVQKRNYWSHGNSMCNLWRKFLWNFTLYCKSPPRCWSMFLLLQNMRWRGETRWEWERGGWGWDGMGGKMDKQNVWSMLTVEWKGVKLWHRLQCGCSLNTQCLVREADTTGHTVLVWLGSLSEIEGWGFSNRNEFPTALEAKRLRWECLDGQVLVKFCPWWGPGSSLHPHMEEGLRGLLGSLFYKSINHIHGVCTLMTSSPPQGPPSSHHLGG